MSTQTLAQEQALVTTDWASEHLHEEGIRFVEVDVDTEAYDSGHLPGAVGWNWKKQLQDQVQRNIASREFTSIVALHISHSIQL